MTTIAATRARIHRSRLTVSGDAFALTTLAAGSLVLGALTWATWGDVGSDTGYDLVAGARVAGGELPYVDYIYYYGPLSPLLLGALMYVGGTGLLSAVVLGLALAAAIVGTTYALARTLLGPLGAFLTAALTAPIAFGSSNFSYVVPHTYSASLGLLLALVFLLAVSQYAQKESRHWMVVAGSAAGLVTLTRPEFALAVLLAGALWLTLRRRQKRQRGGELFWLTVPALGVPAAVYGAFLTAVPVRTLLLENLYPADALEAGGDKILRLHAPLTFSSFADLGVKLALYAAGSTVLVVAARRLGIGSGRTVTTAVLATAGLIGAAAIAVRPETVRYGLEFAYGWIPAGALLATTALLWRAQRGGWDGPAQAALVGCVILAVLAAKTYASFFFHAPVPQLAVYAAPLAVLFLARLHLVELARGRPRVALIGAAWLTFLAVAGAGLTLKDAREDSALIRGDGGSMAVRPGEATLYQPALDAIQAETQPGEPILLAPQLTALYTVSDREDPLPQISLLPGALPAPAGERTAIGRLEEAGVRLAVIDRRAFPEYGHSRFGESFNKEIAAWLRERFSRTAVLGPEPATGRTLEIWVRRSQ